MNLFHERAVVLDFNRYLAHIVIGILSLERSLKLAAKLHGSDLCWGGDILAVFSDLKGARAVVD